MASNLTTGAGFATAAAGQNLGSSPVGSVSGLLQGGISNLSNTATSTLNRFFPPERRADLQAKLTKFASEKPYLASFLFSQIALSGLPIVLFAVFTVGVGIFALLVALIIAVLGAVLFTVFMAGVALLVLLPTLFITTFSAAFIWLWGVGLYYFIKWFNEKPVPGVHTSLKDGLKESTGLNAIHGGFNDPFTDHKMPGSDEQDPSGRKEYSGKKEPDGEQQQERRQSNQQKPSSQLQKPSQNNKSNTSSSSAAATKPTPLSEKKDGANSTNSNKSQKRSESPSVPAIASKTTGSVKSAGSDVTKRTSGVAGGLGGGIQGIAA